jgi:flagellar hook-length control protein FliK
MLDFRATDGASGALGWMAPDATSPPRRASHNGKARSDFADQLDASLNRAANDENGATDDEPTTSLRHAGEDDRSSEPVYSSSADDDDDEQGEIAAPAADVAATGRHDEAAKSAACAGWTVAPNPATADAAEKASGDGEIADAASETDIAEATGTHDLRAIAGQLQSGVSSKEGASAPNRTAEQQNGQGRLRLNDDVTAPPLQEIAAETVAETTPPSDAPAGFAPKSASLDTAAVTAAADPDVPNTVVTVTETAFDQLGGGEDERPTDAESKAGTSNAIESSDTHSNVKSSSATFEAQVSHASESRPAIASAQAAMASHRLAEFESAARATDGAMPAHTPAADTSERIVQSLRLQFQRGGGDAIVHIKPEHLGPLTVSLRVENGTVSARVIADNPAVVEWLQSNEHTLRDGLKANGLQLDRLVINRDQDPSSRTPHRESPESRRGPLRRPSEGQSTFEITV